MVLECADPHRTADFYAAVLGLGARLISGDHDGFRVFADRAGHPFCLTYG